MAWHGLTIPDLSKRSLKAKMMWLKLSGRFLQLVSTTFDRIHPSSLHVISMQLSHFKHVQLPHILIYLTALLNSSCWWLAYRTRCINFPIGAPATPCGLGRNVPVSCAPMRLREVGREWSATDRSNQQVFWGNATHQSDRHWNDPISIIHQKTCKRVGVWDSCQWFLSFAKPTDSGRHLNLKYRVDQHITHECEAKPAKHREWNQDMTHFSWVIPSMKFAFDVRSKIYLETHVSKILGACPSYKKIRRKSARIVQCRKHGAIPQNRRNRNSARARTAQSRAKTVQSWAKTAHSSTKI